MSGATVLHEWQMLLIAFLCLAGAVAVVLTYLAVILHSWFETRRNKGPTE